jgi:hypothetical protein
VTTVDGLLPPNVCTACAVSDMACRAGQTDDGARCCDRCVHVHDLGANLGTSSEDW